MNIKKKQESVYIDAGQHELVIKQRYQVLSYLNDILLGVLYLIGSILFLSDVSQTIAISFFIGGSILMIARAVINIAKGIHLKRISN
ncbi:YrhK family protein [Planococcus lenghuensis]|uniref:YrhK domain-containing protein n=1 Tax=Planococcus lenghuensis TaxID=2213202 RepID=A0A1Q2KYW4_9BACL|nr:YrhK family protein [Planococcus lenghuensis]AQQ53381.1 hypothetical protein B0X71_10040 [Planococcus lenghuensis]